MNLKLQRGQLWPLVTLLFFLKLFVGYSQNLHTPFQLHGQVTIADGIPLPGVTVKVKGRSDGTTTDFDGKYTIVVSRSEVLIFSSIGFETQELVVKDQSEINIKLKEDTQALEEVVVIGYGTQKKSNLTGALEVVAGKNLINKPVISISQALQGELVGASIQQGDGRPGSTASISIRGNGTFSSAGNNPLVLIDGIPGDLNNLNPNDIDNISVLKDASSAAIYGSRAANGVILIQTKRGKNGKTEVTYDATFGFNELADQPRFVDSWIYAQAYNEALTNAGQGKVYSDQDIENYRNGIDPDLYPNDKHYKMAFDNIAYQTAYNISLSGGEKTTSYRLSFNYLRNDGLLQNNLPGSYKDNLKNFYNKYNLRLNIDNSLSDRLKLTGNFSGVIDDEKGPGAQTGDRTTMRVVTRIARMPATIPDRTSEGFYGRVDKGAPWADMDSESFELEKNYNFLGNVNLNYQMSKSFSALLRAGYVFNHSSYKLFAADEQVDATTYNGPAKLDVNWNTTKELTLEGILKYEREIDDHDISVLTGYSQIESKNEYLTGFRDQFPTNDLFELDAGSSENQRNTGGASEYGLVSYFGRVQYNFRNLYLLEANVRYDGSSRFRSGRKYGVFPSMSFGWNVFNEKFFATTLPWMSNMKLRGSWGRLGNQQIGNYPYQAVLSSGANAIWGNDVHAGIVLNTLPTRNISWETTEISDVGVDFSILENHLSGTVDYYSKTTRDILYSVTTSGTLGLNTSPSNAGKVQNRGWDFVLNYRDHIGGFSFTISPRYSLVSTEVLELSDVERDIAKGLFVGQPLNAIYGYEADGLFVDNQDIENYPQQPYTPVPGDIRYKDISGPEGIPDGQVDPAYDRKVIGQTTPKYNYGLQFNGSWKGFDFSMTWDGSGGMRKYLNNMAGRAFANKSNLQQWMWDNRWTPENPNPNASYPRLYLHGGGQDEPYSYLSTFWARNASYLKLRSAQVGYNLPKSLLESLNAQKARLYLSGRNLLTFDNFFEGWDPELNVLTGEGVHYPMTRTYTLGFTINF